MKAASEQLLVIPVSRLAPYGAREPFRVEEGGEVPEGQVHFFLWSTGHRCFWCVGRGFCGAPVTHPEIDEDLWGKWTFIAFGVGRTRFPYFARELARPQSAEDCTASPRRLRLRSKSSDKVARELARHTRTAPRVHGDLVLGASRPTHKAFSAWHF